MKIIAEIGLNHCGDENRGKNLVHDLLQTDVDGITFQVRESSFYDHSHPRKKELKDSFYFEMAQAIKESGKDIGFAISRPEKINILPADFWKTLSWDLGNIKFLNDLRSTERPIFVSTGMSSLKEIVNVSSSVDCLEFIHTQLDDKISGVNLKAISTIAQATQRPCGFGLHCELLEVLYSSISFTPSNIFFYVKDETGLENPDDYWAISISKVDEVTRNLKKLSTAVGDGKKEAKENVLHPIDDNITKKTI